ncbi:MAG: tRNA pseudouridine(55) synthase TruB [Acidimicrobiales bacterium]
MSTTSGVVLVDKPGAMTSHDVIDHLRRLLSQRRIGHAGTLDPMATGLLVVAVGPATRLLRFAQAGLKRYEGTAVVGVATDSLDADGREVGRAAVPALDQADLDAVAANLRGTQLQVPPMVSALKVGGRRLHELARDGVEVPRDPRSIEVVAFELRATERPDRWAFAVTCSPGTYVRVLVSDAAQRLGTLAHLDSLRRVASGAHRVDDALSLEDVAERVARGSSVVSPARELVADLAPVTLSEVDEVAMRRGQRLDLADAPPGARHLAALDRRGTLIGVIVERDGRWQPDVVLPADG